MNSDEIIAKQLKELNESELFQEDKKKYLFRPITSEILTNYDESTSWLRANIFVNEMRIIQQIGIGFVGTGGGSNLFDYLFRDKSSRAIIFADMPYHQESAYREYKSGFNKAGVIMINDKFYKTEDMQSVSAASEFMSEALCYACMDKMERILDEQNVFKKNLALSISVDFGSENDKPARVFIETKLGSTTKKFGYLFSEKDSREKMNNTIAILVLNILAGEINYRSCLLFDMDYLLYDMDSVEIDKFPKRTSELIKEENKKYYDKLYLLV